VVHISVVSPVYQAASIVPELVEQLSVELHQITDSYEIILVDDRSKDSSWESIKSVCTHRTNVVGLRLSRNFGQHSAITAGLAAAKGEWIIVMDCDLQDRPDQISKLYSKAVEGYDLVYARRQIRKDPLLKSFYPKVFYFLFSYLTNTVQDPAIANFGIYNKKVVNGVLSMNDSVRYFPTMTQWVGFNSTSVNVSHSSRSQGKSSYTFSKSFRLAINNIISFSDKPLRLVAQLGLLISFLSLLVGIYYFCGYIFGFIKVAGYTSIIISIWLTAGFNIFILGLIGIYLGKAFEKVKGRPIYIIDDSINNG